MDEDAPKKSNANNSWGPKSRHPWATCLLCLASGHSVIYCPRMGTKTDKLIQDIQERGLCIRCLRKTSDCSRVICGLAFNARNTQYFSTDCPCGCEEDGKKLNKRICGHYRRACGCGKASTTTPGASCAVDDNNNAETVLVVDDSGGDFIEGTKIYKTKRSYMKAERVKVRLPSGAIKKLVVQYTIGTGTSLISAEAAKLFEVEEHLEPVMLRGTLQGFDTAINDAQRRRVEIIGADGNCHQIAILEVAKLCPLQHDKMTLPLEAVKYFKSENQANGKVDILLGLDNGHLYPDRFKIIKRGRNCLEIAESLITREFIISGCWGNLEAGETQIIRSTAFSVVPLADVKDGNVKANNNDREAVIGYVGKWIALTDEEVKDLKEADKSDKSAEGIPQIRLPSIRIVPLSEEDDYKEGGPDC